MQVKNLLISGFALIAVIVQAFTTQNSVAQDLETQTILEFQIIITEIGAFETSDNEWVEIYNNSEISVDLTGWKFFEDGTNHGISIINGTTTLGPAAYAVIANKSNLFLGKYPDYNGALFDSSWGSLKEEGEEIGLKNAGGEIVELFIYPASIGGTSLERVDFNLAANELANWQNHPDSHSIGEGPERAGDVSSPESTVEVGVEPEPELGSESESESEAEPEPESEPGLELESEPGTSPQLSETPPLIVPPTPASITPTPSTPPAPPVPPAPAAPPSLPPNDPPVAVIEIQSGSLIADGKTTVNFDGRASFDPNGDALTYEWDMGDGTAVQTANPGPHSYKIPRIYKVVLTVTDPSGAIGRSHETVQVTAKNSSEPSSKIVSGVVGQKSTSEEKSEKELELESEQKSEKEPKKKSTTKTSTRKTKLIIPEMPEALLTMSGYFVFVPYDQEIKFTQKESSAQKDTSGDFGSSESKKSGKYADGDKSTSIQITEIFPGPSSNDPAGEWIEITNHGDSAVNLGNWGLADTAKKDSPYPIPDTIIIESGQYIIFKKSDTKIALNNGADSVFLTDYEGNVVDSISYENAVPANSYALVDIFGETVATYGSSWKWTDQATPGRQNPSFEKLEGIVTKLSGNEAQIALSDGSSKKISFSQKTLDPLLAQVVMGEGTRVSVQARQAENGQYELEKIDTVLPVQPEKNPTEKSYLIWYIFAAGTIIFAVIGTIYFRKFHLKSAHSKTVKESTEEELWEDFEDLKNAENSPEDSEDSENSAYPENPEDPENLEDLEKNPMGISLV